MLLSEILPEITDQKARFIRERGFDYLSLLVPVEGISSLSFLDGKELIEDIPNNLTMLLTTEEILPYLNQADFGLCIVQDPRTLFFQLHNYLSKKEDYRRSAFPTRIDPSAQVSPLASIADSNVVIGADVVIEPFVMIYPDTTIGKNAIVRAGSVIGGTGFEFKRLDRTVLSVSHTGGVVIGDHVEVQNNTCIDRAIYPWDDTRIDSYTKIDNQVYIAHGCKLGKRILITAHTVVGGRVVIGDDVWLGFGTIIRNGLTIGNRARVNMGAVVTRSVGDDESVTGNFAIPHDQFIALMKMNLKSLEEQDSKP